MHLKNTEFFASSFVSGQPWSLSKMVTYFNIGVDEDQMSVGFAAACQAVWCQAFNIVSDKSLIWSPNRSPHFWATLWQVEPPGPYRFVLERSCSPSFSAMLLLGSESAVKSSSGLSVQCFSLFKSSGTPSSCLSFLSFFFPSLGVRSKHLGTKTK